MKNIGLLTGVAFHAHLAENHRRALEDGSKLHGGRAIGKKVRESTSAWPQTRMHWRPSAA
jgi:hypothetical protein